MANTWREKFKSGPLSGLYLLARNTKRRMRREPLAGTLAIPQVPLSVEEMRNLVVMMPDHGRLYFSLAMAYLLPRGPVPAMDFYDTLIDGPPADATAHRKALACLRCAETLRFESPERIALYKAWIYRRLGDATRSSRLMAGLNNRDFADMEFRLISQFASEAAGPLEDAQIARFASWEAARREAEESGITSVIVIGDSTALSAEWLPDAKYLLCDTRVTGLLPEIAARVGFHFSLGVGTYADQERARNAGIQVERWIIL